MEHTGSGSPEAKKRWWQAMTGPRVLGKKADPMWILPSNQCRADITRNARERPLLRFGLFSRCWLCCAKGWLCCSKRLFLNRNRQQPASTSAPNVDRRCLRFVKGKYSERTLFQKSSRKGRQDLRSCQIAESLIDAAIRTDMSASIRAFLGCAEVGGSHGATAFANTYAPSVVQSVFNERFDLSHQARGHAETGKRTLAGIFGISVLGLVTWRKIAV
jgi:hypothetical protein